MFLIASVLIVLCLILTMSSEFSFSPTILRRISHHLENNRSSRNLLGCLFVIIIFVASFSILVRKCFLLPACCVYSLLALFSERRATHFHSSSRTTRRPGHAFLMFHRMPLISFSTQFTCESRSLPTNATSLDSEEMFRPLVHTFRMDTFESTEVVVGDAQSEGSKAAAFVKQNTESAPSAPSLPPSPSDGNKLPCSFPEVCFLNDPSSLKCLYLQVRLTCEHRTRIGGE